MATESQLAVPCRLTAHARRSSSHVPQISPPAAAAVPGETSGSSDLAVILPSSASIAPRLGAGGS
uniref:Uncharacterized protein n=1 Tax=Arundo donax TaxID=35708 RepID=A0A0A9E7Z2_ARUDO